MLFISISVASYYGSRQLNRCLGAPYLYVSYGTNHNIRQITRDGCVTMNKVLYRVPRRKVELRSLVTANYEGMQRLVCCGCSAYATDSVLVFRECSYWSRCEPSSPGGWTSTPPSEREPFTLTVYHLTTMVTCTCHISTPMLSYVLRRIHLSPVTCQGLCSAGKRRRG